MQIVNGFLFKCLHQLLQHSIFSLNETASSAAPCLELIGPTNLIKQVILILMASLPLAMLRLSSLSCSSWFYGLHFTWFIFYGLQN